MRRDPPLGAVMSDVRVMAKKTYTKLFRQQFVDTWFGVRDLVTFGEHCARFGVSRQAAYEWLRKFDERGADALATQSSAPHRVRIRRMKRPSR
jgi:transposase-like protein